MSTELRLNHIKTLIIKLGASGVRTTPLLTSLLGQVTWLTAAPNSVLLEDLRDNLRSFSWEKCAKVLDTRYDLVVNLEDTLEVTEFLKTVACREILGAYVNSDNRLVYTENSKDWFDLSLISFHGRQRADRLKFLNRRANQEIIFSGLGFRFTGEAYLLPEPLETGLSGDVAIAADAGQVWPMKKCG